MKKYVIGIDNGGTTTKAAIFDIKGNEIAVVSSDTPTITPQIGYYEQDMELLWKITADVIKVAIQKSGIDAKEILAIGCAGHGKGLYLWGKNGKPAYNAIASTDCRAEEYIKRWRNDGTIECAKEKTLQNILSCQPVAILAWINDNMPDIADNTQWIFEAKDYIRFMLTGEAYAEMTDYSGTGLMNLKAMSFDIDLMRLFSIENFFDKLPPLRFSYDRCGVINQAASDMTGLPEGTPVCGGMFDIDACAIAMNVCNEDKLCVISGTWSINEYVSKTPVKPDGTTQNSLFSIPDYYLIEESSATSAGNLDWYIENFVSHSEATSMDKMTYFEIDKAVEKLNPAETSLIFLPFLYGTNSVAGSAAAFVGLRNTHDRAHMLRAIFEGVVFSHMYHIEKLLSHNPKLSSIRLAGGAAKSKVWVQMFADVTGLPIEIVRAKEIGALGCAMAAAVSIGVYADYQTAAAEMVSSGETVMPNLNMREIYTKKYGRYKLAMSALEGM